MTSIFAKLPTEIIHMILNYTNIVNYSHARKRYISKFSQDDPRYKMVQSIPNPTVKKVWIAYMHEYTYEYTVKLPVYYPISHYKYKSIQNIDSNGWSVKTQKYKCYDISVTNKSPQCYIFLTKQIYNSYYNTIVYRTIKDYSYEVIYNSFRERLLNIVSNFEYIDDNGELDFTLLHDYIYSSEILYSLPFRDQTIMYFHNGKRRTNLWRAFTPIYNEKYCHVYDDDEYYHTYPLSVRWHENREMYIRILNTIERELGWIK